MVYMLDIYINIIPHKSICLSIRLFANYMLIFDHLAIFTEVFVLSLTLWKADILNTIPPMLYLPVTF